MPQYMRGAYLSPGEGVSIDARMIRAFKWSNRAEFPGWAEDPRDSAMGLTQGGEGASPSHSRLLAATSHRDLGRRGSRAPGDLTSVLEPSLTAFNQRGCLPVAGRCGCHQHLPRGYPIEHRLQPWTANKHRAKCRWFHLRRDKQWGCYALLFP
jgi:hypothetical protein